MCFSEKMDLKSPLGLIRIVEVLGIESGMLHHKPVRKGWFFVIFGSFRIIRAVKPAFQCALSLPYRNSYRKYTEITEMHPFPALPVSLSPCWNAHKAGG